ncbi:MAG: hypothetical protein FJX75_20015 [Armatimonadetes bacterium]|nr:hypothetical protein [Armatimonadota bacterium]
MGAVGPWRGVILVPVCLVWTLVRSGNGPSADETVVPAPSRVLWQSEANLDGAPGNERLIQYVVAETVAAPWGCVVIHRLTGSGWRAERVWSSDGCDPGRVELRDLDADGALELVIWEGGEDASWFDVVDFRDGQFRTAPGLHLTCWAGDGTCGFVDLDGDRRLEAIVSGQAPGYRAALLPGVRIHPPTHEELPQDRDVRIYRLVNGKPHVSFPPPSAVAQGLRAGLVSGYPGARAAAAEAAGILRAAETVPRLLALVADREEEVAIRAVEALVRIGGPEAEVGLRQAAADQRHNVAGAAGAALAALRAAGPRSVEPDATVGHRPEFAEAGEKRGVRSETLPALLSLSRQGDHRATVGLASLSGAEVEAELARALHEELPNGCYWNYWGDYEQGEPGSEGEVLTEGWFTQVARRLGRAAVSILVSRLTEVAEGDIPPHHSITEGPSISVAVAAAHCLRELGATEAIPALLEVAASHPEPKARDVAAWSVVALRRQGARADQPWFAQPGQRPLVELLGPGGPWSLVHTAAGRLDGDPEAELVVTYREGEPEATETTITRIAALKWIDGSYQCASSEECVVSRASSLEVRDIDRDELAEVILTGADGRFPMLAVYGWRGSGLALLSRFDGYKAPQLMADLDADGIVEVLSGSELERDPERPHDPAGEWDRHAAHWEVFRWHRALRRYEKVGESGASPLLSAGLSHSDDRVRAACAEALGRLRSGVPVHRLLALLGDPQPGPRHAAAWALGNLGSRAALPHLRRVAAADPDVATRETAGLAVARLERGDWRSRGAER